MTARRTSAAAKLRAKIEDAAAHSDNPFVTPSDIQDLKDSLRSAGMVLVRIEQVVRDELAATRDNRQYVAAVAEHTKCLPQLAKDISELLDVLVVKRTNGHTELNADAESPSET